MIRCYWETEGKIAKDEGIKDNSSRRTVARHFGEAPESVLEHDGGQGANENGTT